MAFFKRLFASKNKPYIPSLEHVDDLTANLAGAHFSVSLPAQNMMGLKGTWRDSVNIYDREIYHSTSCEIEGVVPGFSQTGVFNRDIGLYGKPWQSEVLADLNVAAYVTRVDNLPENMSCFQPPDFERVIHRLMYFDRGPGNFEVIKNASLVPHNWRIRTVSSVNWVQFETKKNITIYPNDDPDSLKIRYRSFLMTPIDAEYFLVVEFTRNGFTPSELSNMQIDALQNTIIESFHLSLAESPQQRKREVEAADSYKPLSPSKDLYKWQFYDVRPGNTYIGEPEWVVSAPGSPAPDYNISG